MVDLRAFANLSIFYFNKISNFGSICNFSPGAQAGIRANHRLSRHMAALQMAKSADFCAGFNRYTSAENHVLFNKSVAANHRIKA